MGRGRFSFFQPQFPLPLQISSKTEKRNAIDNCINALTPMSQILTLCMLNLKRSYVTFFCTVAKPSNKEQLTEGLIYRIQT